MIDRRFRMDELGDAFGSDADEALEMGRFLESAVDEATRSMPGVATGFDAGTEARGGFEDRVMAALADEPAPAPAGFLQPLRRRGFLGGLVASFRQAAVATRGAGRPLLAIAAALAYVLVLSIAGVSLTGVATIGTAGALGLLGPRATESPTPILPPATPPATLAPPTQPLPTFAPSPSVTPPVEASPTPSPTETDDSPEGSDDHGGNSGPGGGGGSGDDSSGPGGGDDSSGRGSGSAAEPSDDHGGSSGRG